jgi:hypothetical protein
MTPVHVGQNAACAPPQPHLLQPSFCSLVSLQSLVSLMFFKHRKENYYLGALSFSHHLCSVVLLTCRWRHGSLETRVSRPWWQSQNGNRDRFTWSSAVPFPLVTQLPNIPFTHVFSGIVKSYTILWTWQTPIGQMNLLEPRQPLSSEQLLTPKEVRAREPGHAELSKIWAVSKIK